jgi:hypothetical protein
LAFRPSPILQRPFRRDKPLPHSKSNVGYARLFMNSSGGRRKTKFPSITFLRGESEKTRQSNWLSAPPPVIRCPFQRDIPLPHSKSNVGYARLFMISSGGRGMTKFSSTHIFKGRIKNNMQQSNGFRCQPPVLRCPFQRIRPLPQVCPTLGTLVCL